MNEDIRNRIVSAAYGDVSLIEKFKIKKLIAENPEYKKLYDEFKKTAAAVHNIELEDCPDELVQNAFKLADEEGADSEGSSAKKFFGNPALAGAAAVIMLIIAVLIFNETGKVKDQQYTRAEVVQAEKQVKTSLAVIGRLLNKTSKKLEREILHEKVGKPIQQGIEIINQLFPKGEKSNENS